MTDVSLKPQSVISSYVYVLIPIPNVDHVDPDVANIMLEHYSIIM